MALIVTACSGSDDDEADIRQAMEGYFAAINENDIAAQYDFFSEECKELLSLEEFADLTDSQSTQAFLGENELKVKDVRFIELQDDEAIIEVEVVLVADGEELDITEEGEEEASIELVKEDGDWRLAGGGGSDCTDIGAEPEE